MLIKLLFLAFWFVDYSNNCVLMTVPKSGTHLIENLINILTGKHPYMVRDPDFADIYGAILPERYFWTHFNGTFDFNKIRERIGDKPVIVNIRDPRDVCVSSSHYFDITNMMEDPNDIDEALSICIQYEEIANCFGVLYNFEQAMRAMEELDPLVVRFEDLVGSQGGGDDEAQKRTIIQIVEKMGTPLYRLDVERLGREIYGHSATFRKGQIGSWKSAFKPIHKEQFKNSKLQQVLVKLGYEKDDQW